MYVSLVSLSAVLSVIMEQLNVCVTGQSAVSLLYCLLLW